MLKVRIAEFHKHDDGHWVAELDCGDNRHARNLPPFQERPWVMTADSRKENLGQKVERGLCAQEHFVGPGRLALPQPRQIIKDRAVWAIIAVAALGQVY